MAGISGTDWSWAPLLFDMDNDGIKDLFIANGIKRDYINKDYLKYFEKRFKEITESGRKDKNELITSVLNKCPTEKKTTIFSGTTVI